MPLVFDLGYCMYPVQLTAPPPATKTLLFLLVVTEKITHSDIHKSTYLPTNSVGIRAGSIDKNRKNPWNRQEVGASLLRPRGACSGGDPCQAPRPKPRFGDEGAAVSPRRAQVPLSKVLHQAPHRVLLGRAQNVRKTRVKNDVSNTAGI